MLVYLLSHPCLSYVQMPSEVPQQRWVINPELCTEQRPLTANFDGNAKLDHYDACGRTITEAYNSAGLQPQSEEYFAEVGYQLRGVCQLVCCLPACLSTAACLPTCLPACPPACLPAVACRCPLTRQFTRQPIAGCRCGILCLQADAVYTKLQASCSEDQLEAGDAPGTHGLSGRTGGDWTSPTPCLASCLPTCWHATSQPVHLPAFLPFHQPACVPAYQPANLPASTCQLAPASQPAS